jgi:hypothetical protein
MMNHRLQFSPLSGTRGSATDLPSHELCYPPSNLEDARFFCSWFVYDSEKEVIPGRIDWNRVFGVVLVVVVSVAFWVGVGKMLAHVWK